jgi:hypothetical protein
MVALWGGGGGGMNAAPPLELPPPPVESADAVAPPLRASRQPQTNAATRSCRVKLSTISFVRLRG